MKAERLGRQTWMLVSNSGRCQPMKYLDKTTGNREFGETISAVKKMIDRFLEEGERYE